MQKISVFLVSVMCCWSCNTEPDNLRLFDELVVSTNYDKDAAFGTYSTFAIPTDTIGLISNTNPNDTIIVARAGNEYPRLVLQEVISNMNERSYSRVNRNENPDLGVNVYVVNDLNVSQQVIYPSYYYPYYYGYGSYYSYPYVNTYAYNTGALVIEIVDLKNITPDNKVKVIWSAHMGDVYSTVNLIDQSTDAIDQAFIQSNYLNRED
ncbi:MAG TPA: DUF4136 domain-containing protein [Chryseolinea sp.]|nr:DUF4136 domain-containing protein [Chryseolinea sp.]